MGVRDDMQQKLLTDCGLLVENRDPADPNQNVQLEEAKENSAP